nr:hypothetical protein [Bradyrhizobium sp. WSM1417]
MNDIVEPSTCFQGGHHVYSPAHIRRDALASRVERYSVGRSRRTMKTKGMNAMAGSLCDKHQFISDARKCGVSFCERFRRLVKPPLFPLLPHMRSFMRGIDE